MSLALVTLAVVGLSTAPGGQAAAQTQVQRLREACIATDMNREAFQRAFADRGFEPLVPVVRQGQPARSDWMNGYEDAGVKIVMEGRPPSSDATDCGVLSPRPVGDWRADVDRLALELQMSPVASDGMANALEFRSWTAAGERPLTLHYEVYREAVVIRFARAPDGGQ